MVLVCWFQGWVLYRVLIGGPRVSGGLDDSNPTKFSVATTNISIPSENSFCAIIWRRHGVKSDRVALKPSMYSRGSADLGARLRPVEYRMRQEHGF
jgi:hypothetical protein